MPEVEQPARVARDVSRDVSGNVQFTKEGTDQVTGVTVTGNNVLSVKYGGRVQYDKQVLKVNTGSGNVTIKRGGNVLTSKTFTNGITTTTTGTPRTDGATWTASVSWTALTKTLVDVVSGSLPAVSGSTFSRNTDATLTGTGTRVTITEVVRGSGTGQILFNGVPVATTTVAGGTKKTSTVKTGTFTSPTVTWAIHAIGTPQIDAPSFAGTLKKPGSHTATLTGSRNQVTRIK